MAAVKAIIGVYKKVIRGIFILNGGSGKVSEQETYTVTSKTSIGMSWATGQEIQVLRSSICKDHEERRTCQVQWTKERRVSLEPSEWNSEENKIKEGVEARRVSEWPWSPYWRLQIVFLSWIVLFLIEVKFIYNGKENIKLSLFKIVFYVHMINR